MQIADGRKALITGGASGFGLEIARRLRAAGTAVALLDIDEGRLASAVEELGADSLGLQTDVRSVEEVREVVKRSAEALGGLDTVVISAGVFHMGALSSITEAEWDRTLDVNLKGAFVTAQATMPYLQESGRGRMVTIASDAGKRGFPLQMVYTASKFGLVGLTESLAAEFAPDRVTVNAVCPVGCPTTGMGEEVLAHKIEDGTRTREEVIRSAAATNALGRNATETDVADAVLFLLSEQASFLTGIALDVDGGAHLAAVPGLK
jgi:NAD(P)-dependent dehydrogenase (short-subunit alcohol dehydrogenase family)